VSRILSDRSCVHLIPFPHDSDNVITTDYCILACGALENARLAAQLLDDPTVPRCFPVSDHLVQGWEVMIPREQCRWFTAPTCDGLGVIIGDADTRTNLFLAVSRSVDHVIVDAWSM